VEVYPYEGDGVLLGVYAPEGVFAVQVLDEVFADDLVEFIGPVFVGGVGAHHEEEIDVVFPEEEGVTVEETVFELFLNVFLELVVGLELGVRVIDLTVRDSVADEEVGRDVVTLGEGVAEALEFFAREFHIQGDGVAVAELVEFLDTDGFLQVEFLDVVLDGVAGIGELLVYGLSYTFFNYEKPSVVASADGFVARVTVRNTGSMPGREVLQLYVSAPSGGLDKPARELKGFAKTRLLAPGESETVEIPVSLQDLASWNEKKACWETARGAYHFCFGLSADKMRTDCPVRVKKTYLYGKHD